MNHEFKTPLLMTTFHEILVGLSRNSYFLIRVVWSLKHMYCLVRIVMSENSRFSKSVFCFRAFFPKPNFDQVSLGIFFWNLPGFFLVFRLHSQCQNPLLGSEMIRVKKSIGFFFSHFEANPFGRLVWKMIFLWKKGVGFQVQNVKFQGMVTNIYHTNQLLIEGKYIVRRSSHVNFARVFYPEFFH